MLYESDWKYKTPLLHNVLERQGISQLLEERITRRFILISAKAGEGKSTVMADFLNRHGYRCAWIRLTPSHSSPDRFLSEIDQATGFLIGEEPVPDDKVRVPTVSELEERLHLIQNGPAYIVLDDFEHIGRSGAVCGILEEIADRIPDPVRIAILTRELPDMALARIRLTQNLVEITDDELAFDEEECLELFRDVFHLEITKDTARRIVERSGGWITGIILLIDQLSILEDEDDARGLIDSFLSGSVHPDYVSFFEEEVIDTAEPGLVEKLVVLGAFPRVTDELAEDILGPGAEDILRRASEGGLFLSPDDPGFRIWTFNPLFADYLSDRFDLLDSERQKTMLTTAAGRYIRQDMAEEALRCFVRAGVFNEAKTLFIGCAERLIQENKLLRIRDLLAVFPQQVIGEDQFLEFYGLIADNLYHPEETKRKLLQLLPFFEKLGDADRQSTIYSILLQNYFFYQEPRDSVESLSAMTQAFLQRSHENLEPRKRQLLEALLPLGRDWRTPAADAVFEAAMRAEETSINLHNDDTFLCSRLVLARKYINRGDFPACRELLEQTLAYFGDERYGHPYASLTSFYLGDVLFHTGDIHSAIRQVQEGLENSTPEFAFRPYLEINLILYNLYLNKFQYAENLFETIRDHDVGENLYLRYFKVYHLQMLIAYRTRNRRRAAYYCRRLLEPENRILLNTDQPFSLLSLLEVSIWIDDQALIDSVLWNLDGELIPQIHPFPLATSLALQAVHAARKNRRAESAELAARSLAILDTDNFTNLDICDPDVLHEAARLFGRDPGELFPRLQSLVTSSRYKEQDAQLVIQTLGIFRIIANGVEVPVNRLISQKRVMDLLKLLIIFRKNGVVKEMVYDPFWPKYSLKNARDNLNTIFYRLRNILGKDNDFFVANATTIGFRDGVLDTDVDRFLEFIRLGEEAEEREETGNAIDMFSHAVDIYGGDFLAGDLYSDFIRDERHMIQRRYVNTLFRLAKLHLDSGDYLQALDRLKVLLERDPVCEPAVRLLMIASAQAGNRNSIPQIFADLRGKLLKSYGLEPDEMTVRLKSTLLSGIRTDSSMWKNEILIT